jgi:hypothetical protein
MAYLAIIVILLAIIAPIIAILPSRRQKEQMQLRKRAMADGFSIELTRIDDPDPDPQKYLSNTGKPLPRVMDVIAYRYKRPRPSDWRRLPDVNWCIVRKKGQNSDLPGDWTWSPASVPGTGEMSNDFKVFFRQNIERLPADVIKIEEVKYIISVYWREHGGDESLDAIIAFVKACAEIEPYEKSLEGDDEEP